MLWIVRGTPGAPDRCFDLRNYSNFGRRATDISHVCLLSPSDSATIKWLRCRGKLLFVFQHPHDSFLRHRALFVGHEAAEPSSQPLVHSPSPTEGQLFWTPTRSSSCTSNHLPSATSPCRAVRYRNPFSGAHCRSNDDVRPFTNSSRRLQSRELFFVICCRRNLVESHKLSRHGSRRVIQYYGGREPFTLGTGSTDTEISGEPSV